MAETFRLELRDFPSAPTYYLCAKGGPEMLRVCEGRIYVEGQETSDVERIGDAFKRWAATWTHDAPPHSTGGSEP